ncbi:hypothetical protein A2U01_0112811, partial [Trifolium medium]|nr:hypothetical protein [Trifolium medium]
APTGWRKAQQTEQKQKIGAEVGALLPQGCSLAPPAAAKIPLCCIFLQSSNLLATEIPP